MTWWVQPAGTINGKRGEPAGFDADHFLIDWQHQQATCPEGRKSLSWTPAIDNRTNQVIKIKFSTTDCQMCPSRSLCTHSSRHTRRTVTIRPQEQYLALKQRRERETTKEFTHTYAKRAGIEGTISHGVRVMGLRRSRYIGLARTHLQHLATAAARSAGSQHLMVQWASSRSDSPFYFCSSL